MLGCSINSFAIKGVFRTIVMFIVYCFLVHVVVGILGEILNGADLSTALDGVVATMVGFVLYFVATVVIVSALNISTASLITTFSIINLTTSLTIRSSLSGLTDNVVVLITGPFGVNSCIRTSKIAKAIVVAKLVRAEVGTVSGGMVCIPGDGVVTTGVMGCASRRGQHISVRVSTSCSTPVRGIHGTLLSTIRGASVFLRSPRGPFTTMLSCSSDDVGCIMET